MFSTRDTSRLAKAIATQLLACVGTPSTVTCMSTGASIEGSTDYNAVHSINPGATGAHYLAYGHYYLLCYDRSTEGEYIAVHRASDKKLVGTIERPSDMEILIRDAEVTV